MSNIHRIIWFDQEVRANKYPNANQIAEKFEISVRQANRDIEYLRSSMGAPLKYIAAKRGFEYEDNTFVLPNVYITEEEKIALSYLAYKYENYDYTPKNSRVAGLFKKLTNEEKQEDKIPIFNLDDTSVSLIYKIKCCIKEKKRLHIKYADEQNGMQNLIIHPYDIYTMYKNDYVAAFCEDTGTISGFTLERIVCIESDNRSFSIHTAYDQTKLNPDSRKVPFKAIIEFEEGYNSSWFMGREIRRLPSGFCEIEFEDLEEFIKDLLMSKNWRRIHSPTWLKSKLKNRCMYILEKINSEN
ncbi:MAG: WYL domain-containing protein [Clostridia bacterium]|nr:WYL domain-containing protein [Clostridia bacterium]